MRTIKTTFTLLGLLGALALPAWGGSATVLKGDLLDLKTQSTPSNPASGRLKLYLKSTDNKVYKLDSTGTESVVGSGAGGLFDGGQNSLTNSGGETDATGWTASGGTFVRTTTSGEFIPPSVGALSWDSSSAAQTLTANAVSITGQAYTNGVFSCAVKCATGTCSHKLEIYNGSSVVASSTITSSTTAFQRTSVNLPFASSGTYYGRITSVAADEPKLLIDNCYMGQAELFNWSQVSQAQLVGKITWNCTSAWSGAVSASWTNYGTNATCTTALVGDAQVPATNVPGVKMTNVPPGRYVVVANTTVSQDANVQAPVLNRLIDTGLLNASAVSTVGGFGTNTEHYAPASLQWVYDFTSTQSSVQWQIQYLAATASTIARVGEYAAGNGPALEILIYRFPTSSEQAFRPEQFPVAPTVTRLTSGSGTYTVPAGAKALRIRMVGGGGGGGGSGTASAGSGGTGGNTTFGSSLLTANGGTGGGGGPSGTPVAGGSTSISAPAVGSGVQGSQGTAGSYNNGASNTQVMGGSGGQSSLGGAGGGSGNTTGGVAQNNSGSGGGGAGGSNLTAGGGGAGGAAGGFIDAWIGNPSATYSYAVGAAGTAGSAGTSGQAGGAGGSGLIEITEFYNAVNVPLLVGSVTSGSTGSIRTEYGHVANSGGTWSVSAQSGSWLSISADNGVGDVTLGFAAGYFSAAPACTVTPTDNGVMLSPALAVAPSTTGVRIRLFNKTDTLTNGDNPFDIVCVGPR